MFKVPLFTDRSKPIAERCRTDPNTRLRLKYAPYYHVVEEADGLDVVIRGRRMTMMCSNEYLGLSVHPEVRRAAKEAVDRWGTSPCGSRLANGSRGYHVELEEEMAAFLGKEACHVSVAGYMACMSSLSSLAQREDALIVDKSIHASLWDGVRLSGAEVERFTHEDMRSLRALLGQLDPGSRRSSPWTACTRWKATSPPCRRSRGWRASTTPFWSSTIATVSACWAATGAASPITLG